MAEHPPAAFWDRIAEDYAKRPRPNPEATAKKLVITRQMMGKQLLDLGCGTGSILLELSPDLEAGEGVDISSVMIGIANQKAAEAGVDHLRFKVAPIGRGLAYAEGQFSCVCAYNLLHLVEDPASLVCEMFRVLQPGGALVTSTPCLAGWFPPYGLILPVLHWLGRAPPVTLLSRPRLLELVVEAGFVEVQTPEVGESRGNVFLTARKPG